MKGKAKYIIAGIATFMFLGYAYYEMFKEPTANLIDYSVFKENFSNKKEVVVYIDKADSKTRKSIIFGLNNYQKTTQKKYQTLEYDNLSEAQKEELKKLDERILSFPSFLFIKNNELISVRNGAYSSEEIKVLSNKYFENLDVEIRYKVPASAEDFIKRAEKEEILMLVLGRTSCSACQSFKTVYNNLAEYYNVDIYYLDSDYYSADEYNTILLKDYKIPGFSISHVDENNKLAKCTTDGNDSSISIPFSTPTTIFIKNGTTVDCILGYISTESLAKVFDYHQIPLVD